MEGFLKYNNAVILYEDQTEEKKNIKQKSCGRLFISHYISIFGKEEVGIFSLIFLLLVFV